VVPIPKSRRGVLTQVRQAVARQPRDLGLLHRQLIIARGDAGFGCRLATLEPMLLTINNGVNILIRIRDITKSGNHDLKLIASAFPEGIRQTRVRIF
jgi:hypothetical protein